MTDELVTIVKFQSLPEAEACKLRFEAEGVTVYLTDAETIRADWLLSNAIGSIKVQVPKSQVERATILLEQIRQRNDEQSKRSDEDFCLACGAVMPNDVSICPACGWTFDDGKENGDEQDQDNDE